MMRRMTKLIDNKLLDLRTPTLAPVNFTVTPELLAQSDVRYCACIDFPVE